MECTIYEDMVASREAEQLIHSVAIHRADCQQLGVKVHYANVSNCLALASKHKSGKTFKSHRMIHKIANLVQHDQPKDLPPPAPPIAAQSVLVSADSGEVISCSLLEKQLVATSRLPSGLHCQGCGLWNATSFSSTWAPPAPFKPYSGTCWNLSAKEFVPSSVEKPVHSTKVGQVTAAAAIVHVAEGVVISPKHRQPEEVAEAGPLELPQPLPRLGFITVAEAGQLIAVSPIVCHAVQPAIAALVLLNGGSLS